MRHPVPSLVVGSNRNGETRDRAISGAIFLRRVSRNPWSILFEVEFPAMRRIPS